MKRTELSKANWDKLQNWISIWCLILIAADVLSGWNPAWKVGILNVIRSWAFSLTLLVFIWITVRYRHPRAEGDSPKKWWQWEK